MSFALNKIVFAIVMLGFTQGLVAEEVVYLHSRELSLPQFQEAELHKDKPFAASLFDASGNLWVIGQTSAWKWTVGEKSLNRIKLTAKNDPLVAMEKSNGYLFVATDDFLYRIRFEPQEIIKYRHPSKGTGETGRLVAGPQSVWWVHTDGIAWFDSDSALKSFASIKGYGHKRRPSWFDHKNRTQWVIRGEELIKVDYRHAPPKTEKIHQARHKFSGIHGDRGLVMVHTNHTIIRFDNNDVITQIIPVDAERKIIASDVNSNVHTYFFNDRLIEIYDIKKKLKYQSKLPVNVEQRVNHLLSHGNFTALIADGIPHLFSHERNLNISKGTRQKNASKG